MHYRVRSFGMETFPDVLWVFLFGLVLFYLLEFFITVPGSFMWHMFALG